MPASNFARAGISFLALTSQGLGPGSTSSRHPQAAITGNGAVAITSTKFGPPNPAATGYKQSQSDQSLSEYPNGDGKNQFLVAHKRLTVIETVYVNPTPCPPPPLTTSSSRQSGKPPSTHNFHSGASSGSHASAPSSYFRQFVGGKNTTRTDLLPMHKRRRTKTFTQTTTSTLPTCDAHAPLTTTVTAGANRNRGCRIPTFK